MYRDWWEEIGRHHWSLGDDKPATDDQQQIIYEIRNAIAKGYKNIVLKLGVGFGKSAIAKTISNMFESSYILTNNTALQKQYTQDYEDIALLMGRGKYNCKERDGDYTCNDCYMSYINRTEDVDKKLYYLNLSPTWKFPENMSEEAWQNYRENTIRPLPMWNCYDCPYQEAVRESMKTDCTVCNYHSLYFNSNIINRFGSRDLIVFDEGHYFEEILCDINMGSLNPKTLLEQYNIDVYENSFGDSIYAPEYWIILLRSMINKLTEEKKRIIGEMHGIEPDGVIRQITHEFNTKIKPLEHKMEILDKNKNLFAINIPKNKDGTINKGKSIKLEPIFSKPFNDELLELGNVRIFMSGTFPPKNMLCRWFGLKRGETYFIEKYPSFPIENRPIICDYVGRFSGGKIHTWQNDIVESKLLEICSKHTYENGVIHCSSNAQVNYIVDLLLDNDFEAYCCYDGGEEDMSKQEIIDEFKSYGGILVGSNIREGLDLKGDLCNFQILFKVPFLPYPKGSRSYERKSQDMKWYYFHVISRIEQSYGRGIRSPNDVCPFYILDECFEDLKRYKHMFSSYFMEAIV